MCDTILATPAATAEHVMLIGKNSDRQRNEALAMEYFPRGAHGSNASLKCTYITIPQASHTHAVLLCRPFWMWGAEMGANECGVFIGNEGLQARTPAPQKMALTGMDLLRLSLERSANAAEAVDTITGLLKQYGQGGNCGHLTAAYYNNSFLIADPQETFVLETIDREWLVQRVSSVHAISNTYSIGRAADRVSSGLDRLIRDSGWSEGGTLNYADVIADQQSHHIGHAGARRARSTSLLRSHLGQIGVAHMMTILRDHGASGQSPAGWHPQHDLKRTLCLHACTEDFPGQTTGSMISELRARNSVHWVTGTAAPCISIFKPAFMDMMLPLHGPLPTDRFNPNTLWWRHERLHRAALMGDFGRFLDDISQERDALESGFRTRVQAVINGGNVADRSLVASECWREAIETEERWSARINRAASAVESAYRAAWLKMNDVAGTDISG